MYISQLLLSLVVASVVVAAPPPPASQKNVIENLPKKSIRCGARHPREQVFTVGQIKTAAETALDLVDSGKKVGPPTANPYPHRYGYMDPTVKLSKVCKRTDNLQEFPITRGKYTGGDLAQIPDRVIIKIKGKNKAVYCGLITHEGAPPAPGVRGPFTSCSG